MNRVLALVLAVATLSLMGCTNTLADARDGRGTGLKQVYTASFDDVWEAIPRAAVESDLSMAGSFKDEGYMLFQRPTTMWSWGERVAVFVEPLEPTRTEVEVVSKRSVKVNVTARDWEPRLHDELARQLAAEPAKPGEPSAK